MSCFWPGHRLDRPRIDLIGLRNLLGEQLRFRRFGRGWFLVIAATLLQALIVSIMLVVILRRRCFLRWLEVELLGLRRLLVLFCELLLLLLFLLLVVELLSLLCARPDVEGHQVVLDSLDLS